MATLKEMMDLSGRVAVITGGQGHIGRAAAEALAELGAAVVLVDMADGPARADLSLTVDLEDEAAARGVPAAVLERFGGLDILVHSAALVGTSALTGWTTPVEEQSTETWRRALEVNLTAPFALTQSAIPALRRSGHGSVIMFSSIYGLHGPDWRLYEGTGGGNPAAYAASKGGLIQLTRWFATTLAPDVRVNAIAPGGVFRNHTDPFLSRYIARTPLGRMGSEDDMKGAVAYLASDLSAYVTGQCLSVDGGWSAW